MNNIESLRAIIQDMTEDQVDIETLNAGLLTSIATSLAIIADYVEEGNNGKNSNLGSLLG